MAEARWTLNCRPSSALCAVDGWGLGSVGELPRPVTQRITHANYSSLVRAKISVVGSTRAEIGSGFPRRLHRRTVIGADRRGLLRRLDLRRRSLRDWRLRADGLQAVNHRAQGVGLAFDFDRNWEAVDAGRDRELGGRGRGLLRFDRRDVGSVCGHSGILSELRVIELARRILRTRRIIVKNNSTHA